jgi:membrane-bound lytic murein transglycosylase D
MYRFCLLVIFLLFIYQFQTVDASGGEKQTPEEAQQVFENIQNPAIEAPKLNPETQEINLEKQPMPDPLINPYKSNPFAVKAVDRNIFMFTDRIREHFILWLSRSGKYKELMQEILKSKNLPEEIVFLSLIESGFNPYAYSRSRAVGPWQFISGTAKRYGLVIDWWRDERKDPVKSTTAAADYLTDLYEMFNSWDLAMAAYNAGEGRIQRAMHRTKSGDYWSLLKTRYIKKETKNYVPKFIAASLIADSPEEYGFKDIEYHEPWEYEEVQVESPLDLEVAAQCAGITYEEIKELNPELRRWCTPPNVPVYNLKIPADKKDMFLGNLAMIQKEERFPLDAYTVKKGDTISKIANKTGIAEKAIMVLNSLDKSAFLKPGSEISLPPKGKFTQDIDDKLGGKKYYRRHNKKSVSSKNKKTTAQLH